MQQAYRRLVQEFCRIAGHGHAGAIADGASFRVDGIDCTLIHLHALRPDALHCYIDFGLVPEAGGADIYRQLLNANYLQLASGSAAFSMSPATGRIVLISTLKLASADPQILHDLLTYHAQQALEWRRTFYLDQAAIA